MDRRKPSCIDGIKILFHNKEIETVAVSKIKLWNGGNEMLEACYNAFDEYHVKIPFIYE